MTIETGDRRAVLGRGLQTGFRTTPVFVSSTFLDMHAERDVLRDIVFPRLEEGLRPRRCNLEWIDLRQGVDVDDTGSERTQEAEILRVCLTEVQRSRPFLVGLIGDRYGWVTSPEQRAAFAREAAIAESSENPSVTALEIEFALAAVDHQCAFFIREPLSYARLPDSLRERYSDAFARDPGAPARVTAVDALKARISSDPSLGDRVVRYQADWDDERRRVDGLEAFAELAFATLWKLLDEFTRDAAPVDSTWQEAERRTQSAFREERLRNYVHREEVESKLLDFALGEQVLARRDAVETSLGPLLIRAAAGSGKSALLAYATNVLENEPTVVTLSHSAAGSLRGEMIVPILQRFSEQLAEELGDPPLAPVSSVTELDQRFAVLLRRVAASRRVVIVIDAVDQLEAFSRARSLAWLPRPWPGNARLIVSARPEALSELNRIWRNVEEIDLPPWDESEARSLAISVFRRLHCPWREAVWHILSNKRNEDAHHSAGSPLWTTLVCEQLSLFNADQFAIAEEVAVDRWERLSLFSQSTASDMPPAVTTLYPHLFEQAAKMHGEGYVRAFLLAIAVSRSGLRERDLIQIIPRLAPRLHTRATELPLLKLAVLRRSLRAHVAFRSDDLRLDFSHAQGRSSALSWASAGMKAAVTAAHEVVAAYLLGLDPEDVLRATEIMHHFISSNALPDAARYLARELNAYEAWGAATVLADGYLVADSDADSVLRGLLREADASGPASLHAMCGVLAHPLSTIVSARGSIEKKLALRRLCAPFLTQLARADPNNADYLSALSANAIDMSLALSQVGRLDEALTMAQSALSWAEQAVQVAPGEPRRRNAIAFCSNSLGSLHQILGDSEASKQAYHRGGLIGQELLKEDPSSDAAAILLATSYTGFAELLVEDGQIAEARKLLESGQQLREALVENDPTDPDNVDALATGFDRLGSLARVSGDLPAATVAFERGLTLCEDLVSLDPANAAYRRSRATAESQLSKVYLELGDRLNAVTHARESLFQREELARADPSSVESARDRATAEGELGNVFMQIGDPDEAVASYRRALALIEVLLRFEPRNAGWMRDRSIALSDLGEGLHRAGRDDESSEALREAEKQMRELHELDPMNLALERDWNTCRVALAAIHFKQEKFDDAHSLYTEALAVADRCAARAPDNSQWQLDRATICHRLGDVRLAQDRFEAAREILLYGESLLASETGPFRETTEHRKIRFLLENTLGNVHTLLDDLLNAERAHHIALGAAIQLVGNDPNAWSAKLDVARCHSFIAEIRDQLGDLEGAKASYETALALEDEAAAIAPNAVVIFTQQVATLYSLILTLGSVEPEGARSNMRRCLELLQALRASGARLPPHQEQLYAELHAHSSDDYSRLLAEMEES